jgi:transcriptional regulator with XRE-family HTH domain
MRNRSTRASRGEEWFYVALGQLLRQARISAGLSLDELADLAGQDRTSILRRECGMLAGSAAQYYGAAIALGVEPGHMLRKAAVIASEAADTTGR